VLLVFVSVYMIFLPFLQFRSLTVLCGHIAVLHFGIARFARAMLRVAYLLRVSIKLLIREDNFTWIIPFEVGCWCGLCSTEYEMMIFYFILPINFKW